MDSSDRLIFVTDLQAQLGTLRRIQARLGDRTVGLTAEDVVRMESVAYQIHNLYGAIEDLLKLVATHFENNIAESPRWHSALLQRMMQAVPGVRPAVLSMETFTALNGLRGFRHFFRHAYEVPLSYEQLMANVKLAEGIVPQLEQDIETFLDGLE
ncbi:MAG: hypothetical protein O3C67_08745 [Cyanobacteria bacterium]|nr:hypothetical protein [Cyanobacteriota bacterium]